MSSRPTSRLIVLFGICFSVAVIGGLPGTALAEDHSYAGHENAEISASFGSSGVVFQQADNTTTEQAGNGTQTVQANNTTTPSENATPSPEQNTTATATPSDTNGSEPTTATAMPETTTVDGPDITVTSLQANKTRAPVDGKIKVTAVVENTGTVAGGGQIGLESLGDTIERSVSLDAGETTTITWVATYPAAGNYIIRSQGETIRVSIFDPGENGSGNLPVGEGTTNPGIAPGDNASAEFEIVTFNTTNTTVSVGQNVTITAVIENVGGERGTDVVTLNRSGEVVRTREISLNPGSSTQIDFSVNYQSPGSYVASVEGREVAITVKRGLDRGGGIGVDNDFNGSGGENVSGTTSGAEEPDSNSSVGSSGSGGGSGGIGWLLLGLGTIGVVVVGFAALEGYARYIRE